MSTPTKVGQTETIKRVAKWHECEICGMPAHWQITFLLPNARHNPASHAYGRDDCSWCADYKTYSCEKHRLKIEHSNPNGMRFCAAFPLKHFKHLGFYWQEVKQCG